MKRGILILTIVLIIIGIMVIDLGLFIPYARYKYSFTKHALCHITPGVDYRPIRVIRMTDQNGGYYCISPEGYERDVPG